MPRMTEEEAWALEDEVTRNPPKVDPAKARSRRIRMVTVDDFSADWLQIRAASTHTTTEAIIRELVREKIDGGL